MEITDGRGVDVVLDTVPVATEPVLDAVAVARIGGTIVLGGIKGSGGAINLDVDRVLYKELIIKGVYSQAREAYVEAFRMLAENKYRLDRLHTNEYPLTSAEEAILTLGREHNSHEQPICVSLHPDSATMTAGGTGRI